MNWDEFRYEWQKVLADTPGLEEAIFLMVQDLCGEQYEAGWDDGNHEGYEEGYDEGFDKGREAGYSEGYEEGFVDNSEA